MSMSETYESSVVAEDGGAHQESRAHIPIFIDGIKRLAPKPAMTGAELKALGEVPPDYQLFLEVPGPTPDIGIRDDEVVDLKPGMHFVAVVPGTLGAGR